MNLVFEITSYSCIKITKLIVVVSFSRVGLNMLLLAFLLLESNYLDNHIWSSWACTVLFLRLWQRDDVCYIRSSGRINPWLRWYYFLCIDLSQNCLSDCLLQIPCKSFYFIFFLVRCKLNFCEHFWICRIKTLTILKLDIPYPIVGTFR
jgi:hypothetical protein